jgi:hypothetical protein
MCQVDSPAAPLAILFAIPVGLLPLAMSAFAWRRPAMSRVVLAVIGCAVAAIDGLSGTARDGSPWTGAGAIATAAFRAAPIVAGVAAALWLWHAFQVRKGVRAAALGASALALALAITVVALAAIGPVPRC